MARTSLLLLVFAAIMSVAAASCAPHPPSPSPPDDGSEGRFPRQISADPSATLPAAPIFCKCTCFKNSTIIPLGPKVETPSRYLFLRDDALDQDLDTSSSHIRPRDADEPDNARQSQHLSPRSKSKSCTECTKAFCLSQGIDFCKKAAEEDVTTLCFQRDSNKDKIIVWGFMFCTIGLLGWAAFKRLSAWRQMNPVGGGSGQSGNYAAMPGNFR